MRPGNNSTLNVEHKMIGIDDLPIPEDNADMSTPLFSRHSFLNPSEIDAIMKRIPSFRGEGIENGDLLIIGAPLEYPQLEIPNLPEVIRMHNLKMNNNFSDLLEKTRVFFEGLFQSSCFFVKELGLPGFTIVQAHPGTARPLWFHQDYMNDMMMEKYPHLGITPQSRHYTFNVLLETPKELSVGLIYFSDHQLGKKVMNYESPRHTDYGDFGHKEPFTPGEMNVFGDCVHSAFVRNDSAERRERFLFQGQLLSTPQGHVLFW